MTDPSISRREMKETPMWQQSPVSGRKNRLVKASLTSFLLLGLLRMTMAQQPAQKTFASPEEASQALFAAAQGGDKAALLEIFGPEGSQIISSGDEVQDQKTRDQFVSRYQEMHRVANEPDGTATLYIGAENWPVPVPLVHKGGAWYFDTVTGKKDILYRRIGKNEFATMEVCGALVDAELDYYSEPRDGRPQQYTQKFASDEGKHNGLYWKTAEGEPESPIGPLVAYAAGEGYGKKQGEGPSPYHGYFYRILTAQGASVPGGAKSYVVNGEMTGGFAIVAYPAVYRSSGVMTFIVNQDGVVYQKDLGAKTATLAGAIKEYAPDKTWRKAE
jgi:Protein of unknown function (DUF2950)